jgi:hypothetical protein
MKPQTLSRAILERTPSEILGVPGLARQAPDAR